MLLHTLLQVIDSSICLDGIPNVAISGVSDDSRHIESGNLFVARTGPKTDGRQYVEDAIRKGAAVVVSAAPIEGCPAPAIVVRDPLGAASRLAHAFYGNPSRSMSVIGVTGTNGKTTTAYLIRHLLARASVRCGMIGTVEIDDGAKQCEATMTTPGCIELSRLMAAMRANGATACAMEVSSHALDQRRVEGIRFAAAGFTNLTWDHMDYHGSLQNYAHAKARLFQSLEPQGVAVVNGADPYSAVMLERCEGRVVRWGYTPECDYRAEQVFIDADGSHFLMTTPKGSAQVNMQSIGRHNIANALTAAALVGEVYGMDPALMASALHDAMGAPGRLQPVRMGQPFGVFVDYAHTEDGLKNVLTALKPLTRGKLRVVFGCGGDRDRKKRPEMAKVAQQYADAIYVTSDNPRTEDADEIIREILLGFTPEAPLTVLPDRHQAIAKAIRECQSGDVLLLAGKGHENYQVIGKTKHHFDDVEEARAALMEYAKK